MTEAATQALLNRITREFSRPNVRPMTMARTMLRSKRPQSRDDAARARYGMWIAKARDQRLDLPVLLARVTCDYWLAISKRNLAALNGRAPTRAAVIDLDALFELRLLLRWLRRHRPHMLAEILVTLARPRPALQAAE